MKWEMYELNPGKRLVRFLGGDTVNIDFLPGIHVPPWSDPSLLALIATWALCEVATEAADTPP